MFVASLQHGPGHRDDVPGQVQDARASIDDGGRGACWLLTHVPAQVLRVGPCDMVAEFDLDGSLLLVAFDDEVDLVQGTATRAHKPDRETVQVCERLDACPDQRLEQVSSQRVINGFWCSLAQQGADESRVEQVGLPVASD